MEKNISCHVKHIQLSTVEKNWFAILYETRCDEITKFFLYQKRTCICVNL